MYSAVVFDEARGDDKEGVEKATALHGEREREVCANGLNVGLKREGGE